MNFIAYVTTKIVPIKVSYAVQHSKTMHT